MIVTRSLTTRHATAADRHAVRALAQYEPYVHTHLDWRPVEDWLGTQPFVIAERGQRMVGALACPPDLPALAWVRLIAVAEGVAPHKVWDALWPVARDSLRAQGVTSVAALSLDSWTEPLYRSAGMTGTHEVVVLSRDTRVAPPLASPNGFRLRVARAADAEPIVATDTAAFVAPWQLSPAMIRLALAQADYLTVVECEGRVVGYQLTTPGQGGAHLARLAVQPGWQGRGLGVALVRDVIAHYFAHGRHEITVNTQHNNHASLAVYHKLGFVLTGTRLPVYQLQWEAEGT